MDWPVVQHSAESIRFMMPRGEKRPAHVLSERRPKTDRHIGCEDIVTRFYWICWGEGCKMDRTHSQAYTKWIDYLNEEAAHQCSLEESVLLRQAHCTLLVEATLGIIFRYKNLHLWIASLKQAQYRAIDGSTLRRDHVFRWSWNMFLKWTRTSCKAQGM